MSSRMMVLPSRDYERVRLVHIPSDMEEHEAFRYATGVIAEAEEAKSDYTWEDIEEALEAHGFQMVKFILGPPLD